MNFTSYAQNFEDVMLWRALKHVSAGFYVDIGAWSPNVDSVTRAFYDAGWHGINVEPNPEFFDQLVRDRGRDINLKVAVSDHEGTLTINFVSNPGLSTANDDFAAKHAKEGLTVRREDVELTTLAAIWQKHIPSDQEVHFLKIDVEGLEEAVVRGNDWKKYRPWVLVLEATLPMSQVESFENWETLLLDNQYVFAYADGLNRYYVAHEHTELLAAFKYPPNVFDEFQLAAQVEARRLADQAHAYAQQAELSLRLLQSELDRATQNINHLEIQLFQVYQSKSWRLTAPLRWLTIQIHRLRLEGFKARLKTLIRKLFQKLSYHLTRYPWLQRFIKSTGLHTTLKRVFLKVYAAVSHTQKLNRHRGPEHISFRSRKIYTQLKTALKRQDKAIR